MRPIHDEDEARAWIADQEAGWADGTRPSWAVEEDGTVVGYVVIKAANPPATLATGVGFGGQHLMPADEVELLHTVGNEGSCRVARTCGYVLDSVLQPLPPAFPGKGHRHLRRRCVPPKTSAAFGRPFHDGLSVHLGAAGPGSATLTDTGQPGGLHASCEELQRGGG